MSEESRVVVVTGAGGAGCGRAIARRFARHGAAVVVSDVDQSGGQATVQHIEHDGGRAAFFQADVRSEQPVKELISFAETMFGGVNVLVNNASISALWHGRKTPGGIPGYDVAKAGMIRMTTRLAFLAATDGIRVNCLAPGWIGTDAVRQYWEPLTPEERRARNMPSRLLTTDQIVDVVVRLAEDRSLAGRILVWWSEDEPRFIEWGDRGYRDLAEFV